MTDDPDLDRLCRAVLARVPDPERGLPDPAFALVLRLTPVVNVDLLVQDGAGRTLLAWRVDEFGTGWHVPGGIIRKGEPAAARIAAVARLELGTRVAAEPSPSRVVEFHGERGHFISLLFRCSVTGPSPPIASLGEGRGPAGGDLAWIEGVPPALYPAHRCYLPELSGHIG